MHLANRSIAPLLTLCMAALCPRLAAQDPEPEEFPHYNYEPYLQSLTSTSVIIVSQSKEEAVARLQYGRDEAMDQRLEEEEPAHDHAFRLEGLQPDTLYHFRVTHIDISTFSRMSFRTLPEPGKEIIVAAIGDSGTLSDA